jgi:hypothetical protein
MAGWTETGDMLGSKLQLWPNLDKTAMFAQSDNTRLASKEAHTPYFHMLLSGAPGSGTVDLSDGATRTSGYVKCHSMIVKPSFCDFTSAQVICSVITLLAFHRLQRLEPIGITRAQTTSAALKHAM